MTKEWGKDAIEALKRLRLRYTDNITMTCPLCKLNRDYAGEDFYLEDCSFCPWIVLEDKVCDDFFDTFILHTNEENLTRIDGWIKRLERGDYLCP